MDENISEIVVLNPLEKEDFIDTILNIFTKYYHIESGISILNERGTSSISIVYKEVFYKLIFNKWKDAIMSIDINELEEKSKNRIIILKKYLQDVKAINGRTAVKLSDPEEIDNPSLRDALRTYAWYNKDDNYIHFDLNVLKRKIEEHKVCLYLNCDRSKLHQIAIEFIRKCQNKNLKYDFTFNESKFVDDNFKIYCDENEQEKYIKIINEIIEENELSNFIFNPPYLTGQINEKIGFSLTNNTENNNYLNKRYIHIEKCIRLVARDWIIKLLDKNVQTNNNVTVPYKKILIDCLLKMKKRNIEKKSQTKFILDNRNVQNIDLNDKEFYKTITEIITKNIYMILNYLLNPNPLFKLEVKYKTKTIIFDSDDIDDFLRKQVELFSKLSDDFKKQLLYKIKYSSPNYDIDIDNYAYDINISKKTSNKSSTFYDIYDFSPTENINNSDKYISSRKQIYGRIIDKNHTSRHKKSLLQTIKDKIGKGK